MGPLLNASLSTRSPPVSAHLDATRVQGNKEAKGAVKRQEPQQHPQSPWRKRPTETMGWLVVDLPLWKILVSWDYSSQYVEKWTMFQTTNQWGMDHDSMMDQWKNANWIKRDRTCALQLGAFLFCLSPWANGHRCFSINQLCRSSGFFPSKTWSNQFILL